jgi:hypothetical protein
MRWAMRVSSHVAEGSLHWHMILVCVVLLENFRLLGTAQGQDYSSLGHPHGLIVILVLGLQRCVCKSDPLYDLGLV